VLADLHGVLFRDRLPSLVLGMIEEGTISGESVKALKASLSKIERQEQSR